jgi:hypothetical protein
MARMGTAWQKFVAQITTSQGANSFIATLKKQIEDITQFLNTPAGQNFAISVQNGLAAVLNGFVLIIKKAYEWRDTIVAAAKIFALMWGGKLVFGIITSVITIFGRLNAIVRVVTTTFMGLRAALAVAGVAQMTMATNTTAAGRAMSFLNNVGRASIGTMAMLAGRFIATAGAVMILVGAVYALANAFNAKASAEARANNVSRKAAAGGTWESKEEQAKEFREINEIKAFRDRAVKSGMDPSQIKWGGKPINEVLDQRAKNYNTVSSNTRQMDREAAVGNFERIHGQDPYGGVNAIWQPKINDAKTAEERQALYEKMAGVQAGAARNDLIRLNGLLDRTKNPAERAAIEKIIQRRNEEIGQFEGAKGALQAENKFVDGGKDAKKKKDKAGSDFDPLDRFRNQYATAFTRAAELQNEFDNLRNGTEFEFDVDAADDTARATAAKIKDEEALRNLINAEKERAKTLQRMIDGEKAIADLQNESADSYNESYQELDKLRLGYSSVALESDHYRDSLERANARQLEFLETQMNMEAVTAEQIAQQKSAEDQYRRLTLAIDDAVRAKQAELLVSAASAAKEELEDHYASFRSPQAQFNFEANRRAQELQAAIALGESILAGTQMTQEVLAARDSLKEAENNLADAIIERNKDAIKAAEEEIVVVGRRLQEEESRANQIARETLPILRERLAILQQEQEMRNRMHGAAGPIMDWAKEAQKGLDNIGQSLGELVTSGLDDLIQGLVNGKMAFGEFVKSIMKGLLVIILRAIIAKAILSALGMATGGGASPTSFDGGAGNAMAVDYSSNLVGGGIGTIGGGHGGMLAGGNPRFNRAVSKDMFSFAQRYHTGGIAGLKPNEVPIIAEKGEGIFTQEQMKALGESRGSNVQVNVINQTGTQAEVQREQPRFDGEKWVENIILKKMSQPGPVRSALTGGMKGR